jgi:hypothetical protein
MSYSVTHTELETTHYVTSPPPPHTHKLQATLCLSSVRKHKAPRHLIHIPTMSYKAGLFKEFLENYRWYRIFV